MRARQPVLEREPKLERRPPQAAHEEGRGGEGEDRKKRLILRVEDIHTYYGESYILHGLSLEVGEREVVSLLGRNGAGKTTTIRSIMGLTPPRRGRITLRGEPISGMPAHQVFRRGVKLVPQGRQILPNLTVLENLKLAMLAAEVSDPQSALEGVYDAFPILKERQRQRGGHLSGGERQMLAIARALIGRPTLILLDEPSEGLAPVLVREIGEIILRIKRRGVAVLLAEQNVELALAVADRHYLIDKGRVRFSGTTASLKGRPEIMETYLGVTLR